MTALRVVAEQEPWRPAKLTPREQSVLRLLADGYESAEMATELGWSLRTIKNVIHDLLTKLNAHTRAHAIAQAVRQGWLIIDNNAMEAARTRIEGLEAEVKGYQLRTEHAMDILGGRRR